MCYINIKLMLIKQLFSPMSRKYLQIPVIMNLSMPSLWHLIISCIRHLSMRQILLSSPFNREGDRNLKAVTCRRSNFKWWSLVTYVCWISEVRLFTPIVIPQREYLSPWEGDGLQAENSSPFIMCFSLHSYIIFHISKVGNGI